MRAINHAMTGAIIGLTVANPVALPLAFASHYLLDSLPHHGEKGLNISSRSFKIMLIVDIILCVFLAAVIVINHPDKWWLIIVCAFLAASPDLMWFGDFRRASKGQPKRPFSERHPSVRFHAWVQWFQKPIGIVIEFAWAAAAVIFLVILLKS